jgi:hypothetical protein
MGDTAYALPAQDVATVRAYVGLRRRQHFNCARVWFNPDRVLTPDNEGYDVGEFRRMDVHLGHMRAAGMHAELILLWDAFFSRGGAPPMTQAQIEAYVAYVVARYAAFRNILLWCVGNEVERYLAPGARPDPAAAYARAAALARFVRSRDPYRHLITVHHVTEAGAEEDRSDGRVYRDFYAGAVDVVQQQKQGELNRFARESATFDGEKVEGDAFGVESWVERDRRCGVPVINGEYGYEYYLDPDGRRCATSGSIRLRHTTKWQRKGAWRVVMAGGYVSAGYERTLWCEDLWQPGREYAGATQLSHLYTFLTELPFDRMQPRSDLVNAPNLCLALPGEVYAAYHIGRNQGGADGDGTLTLDLRAAPGSFEAHWFDPREGAYLDAAGVFGGTVRTFAAPSAADDWVLRLRAVRQAPGGRAADSIP